MGAPQKQGGPEKTQSIWLEKFLAGGWLERSLVGGAEAAGPRPANRGSSWNHQWLADAVGYALEDSEARQNVLNRYQWEHDEGHCGKEQTNASHQQWHLIAHLAIRTVAREREDAEVLALNTEWFRAEWKLVSLFWVDWNDGEEVVYPGSRAYGTAHGGGGVGVPGFSPYLADLGGAIVYGQRNRLRQGYPSKKMTPTEPDSICIRLADELVKAGDDLGWGQDAWKYPIPKLRVPIGIKRTESGRLLFLMRQDVKAWEELVPPITYWVRINEKEGQTVEQGFEPLSDPPVPDEVIGG